MKRKTRRKTNLAPRESHLSPAQAPPNGKFAQGYLFAYDILLLTLFFTVTCSVLLVTCTSLDYRYPNTAASLNNNHNHNHNQNDNNRQLYDDYRPPSASSSTVFSSKQQRQLYNNHSGSGQVAGWSPRVGIIRLIRLDTPSHTIEGQPIKLRCLHESRGDRLQSLSWSRNGREFYRYQPFERNQNHQHLFFNQTGIHPDIHRSRNNTVFLTNTTVETSGRYRCEVTGSQFQEVKMETYINVTSASNGINSAYLIKPYGHQIIQTIIALVNLVQIRKSINQCLL